MCLWCCWKDLDEQDFKKLFGKIWIQNVGDIELKIISITENKNKFQKTRFWKEKLVENMVTFGPMAHATKGRSNVRNSFHH
jgi:hypothetical protein